MTVPANDSDRDLVFISYSHKDKKWRDHLEEHLKPYLRAGTIKSWSDKQIQAGSQWLESITDAVAKTHVAVLLVTPAFLASDFIHEKELGEFLKAADSRNVTILWIPVRASAYKETKLRNYQSVIPPERPLAEMKADRDKAWVKICEKIKDAANLPAGHLRSPNEEPVVSPTKLRHAAAELFGRDEALRGLDAAWEKTQTNIIVICAWGGTGKTALVTEWMAQMAADAQHPWRGAQRVFDWSFYSQGTRTEGDAASADIFIAAALRFFGDPDPQAGSPHDRGERLARLINGSRHLLVLDGLEPLQHPPGPVSGYLTDPAITALLNGLAQHNAGLCIVTTREPVADLAPFLEKTVEQWPLDHLSDAAGAELLYSLGVTRAGAAELEPDDEGLLVAVREVEVHALTLTLMGKYLKLAFDGDVRRRDVFRFDEADPQWVTNPDDPDSPYGHAFKVISAYERWFGDDDAQRSGDEETWRRRQLAVLRLMGLFDRPADAGCLAALRQEPTITGLTDTLVGMSDRDWRITVTRLEEISLLRRDPPIGDTFSLDCHPLIREYFAKRLQKEHEDAWQAGHKRVFEHLCKTTKEGDEPTLEQLQPLYQAVTHGCLAGLHEEARARVYRNRILKGTGPDGFYSARKLGAVGADLGAVACFFDEPWTRLSPNLSVFDQSWLLNDAGFHLRALGRLREALEPLRAALEMRVEQKAWENAAIAAGNLSELSLTLGDIADAVEAAERAVDYADQSGEAFQRNGKRATLADALHQSGRPAEALSHFVEAEEMQAESQPEYPWLYSIRGFKYCDLLLGSWERRAWRILLRDAPFPETGDPGTTLDDIEQRAATALDIVRQGSRNLLDIALNHLTRARVIVYRERVGRRLAPRPMDSGSDIARAVNGLRKAGQADELPKGLLTLAWYLCEHGDEAAAREALDEAEAIAARGPMLLFLADIHLHRARLFKDRDELAKARILIEKHGYNRRLGELEDAESALGG